MTDELAAAFDALGNELRVAIIRALIEHRRRSPKDPGLTFSDLFETVGIEDSGRFNYHLDHLRGTFLEHRHGRYQLNLAGLMIAGSVLNGELGAEGIEAEQVLEGACPRCDTPVTARYADGWLRVACANDLLLSTSVPPRVVSDESLDTAVEFATMKTVQWIEHADQGRCPLCFGSIESRLVNDEAFGQPVYLEQRCAVCGSIFKHPPGLYVAIQPSVRAVFAADDRPLLDHRLWEIDLFRPSTVEVAETFPLAVEITADIGPTSVWASIDDAGTITGLEIG